MIQIKANAPYKALRKIYIKITQVVLESNGIYCQECSDPDHAFIGLVKQKKFE